jgi:hypothetical protein
LVEDKYQESDNRIVILDTETGSRLLTLDIPSAQWPEIMSDGQPGGEKLLLGP